MRVVDVIDTLLLLVRAPRRGATGIGAHDLAFDVVARSDRRGRTCGRTRPGVSSAVKAMPSISSAGVRRGAGRAGPPRAPAGGPAPAPRGRERRASRSASPAARTARRARDRSRGVPGTARPAGGPARAGTAHRRRARSRSRYSVGEPVSSSRAAATARRRGLGPRGDQPRLRVQAALLHLVREAGSGSRCRARGAGRSTKRPAPAGPLDAALLGELGQGAPDGDQADAVVPGELALGGQAIARLPRRRRPASRAGRGRPGGASGRGRARGGSGPCGWRLLRCLGDGTADKACADRDC